MMRRTLGEYKTSGKVVANSSLREDNFKKHNTINKILRMKKSLLLLVTLLACLSAWAEDVNLTEDTNEDEGTAARWYVNMPAGNLESWLTLTDASITTFKVYDNGGKNENYSNGCNSLLHITAPTGYIIQLSGRIKTETSWDKLTVYDSNEASGIKLLDAINGKNSSWLTINTVRSTGQSMTLFFYSDGSSNYEGLDLTVELINPNAKYNITVNPANNGIVESDKI